MAVRLVKSGGNLTDVSAIDMAASGVVHPGGVVEFSRTGGTGVYPGSSSSTTTNIFGVAMDYAQGASDVIVKVIPFAPGQIYEIDCTDAASTAQVGLRHVLNDHLLLRNTATDMGAGNAFTAVFRAIAVTGATTGSGKLQGYFRTQEAPVFSSSTSAGHV